MFNNSWYIVIDFPKNTDFIDSLNCYEASVEARCYGSISKARTLWNDVMTRHGNQYEYWLQYIELERYNWFLCVCVYTHFVSKIITFLYKIMEIFMWLHVLVHVV